MKEKQLVSGLAKFLTQQGYLVEKWVHLQPREIDLVLFDPRICQLLAVEVKKSDWKKALAQARRNRLYAHYSLIAIERAGAEKIPVASIQASGIGLIQIEQNGRKFDYRVLHPAQPSTEINQGLKTELFGRFVRRDREMRALYGFSH